MNSFTVFLVETDGTYSLLAAGVALGKIAVGGCYPSSVFIEFEVGYDVRYFSSGKVGVDDRYIVISSLILLVLRL